MQNRQAVFKALKMIHFYFTVFFASEKHVKNEDCAFSEEIVQHLEDTIAAIEKLVRKINT